MKISVAMCTYNGGRFLQEQLNSIAEQTHAPAELVICDDGSTDNTANLVEAFARCVDFPVRWFRNDVNLGSTRNFAQAIKLCTGEGIALCDQDDRWQPEKLAVCVRALSMDSQTAGVFSNAHLMDEHGVLQSGSLWDRVGFKPAGQQAFRKDEACYLARRDTVTGAALVFRADMVASMLPIPGEWVHDGWIAFILAAVSRLQALPQHLITYRLHQSQQVGAKIVPLSAHLRTERDAALQFHLRMVRRWTILADHLTQLERESWQVDEDALAEVKRKIHFEQARAILLQRPSWQRLLPSLRRLGDYSRYEKGLLSLLRDLTHAR